MSYGPFDKQLELRDVGDGAETTTATEDGIAFASRDAGDFKAIFFVTALDATTGDETYKLAVVTANSKANLSSAPVTIGEVTVTGKGVHEIPLSGMQIAQLDDDASWISCKATLAGTTPSIAYGCYLVPAF